MAQCDLICYLYLIQEQDLQKEAVSAEQATFMFSS